MTDNKKEEPVLICPHCNEFIIIEQINCGIFRHGTLKSNNTQINPHASKEECEYFINSDLIYGCGKPFRIIQKEDNFFIEICEYI
jgi:hypothetical protein